jgi:peptidoglycan/xylan/chitin deacetylase (PgdA/CDA1 family)
MLKVIPPFPGISEHLVTKHLLENNFELKFSAKQKLYYSVLRPVMSIKLRQKLQEKYNSSINYKENFIDDDFVNSIAGLYKDNLNSLYPDSFTSATVLTHDVETEEGFNFIPKVIELEKKFNFSSSWNIVPYKYKIDEGIIRLIKEAGDEIGIHGYNHDGKLYYSEKIFTERVQYINKALKKYEAVGFRSPQVHRNLVWLQKLDILYDASCFDYDPFQPFPGGTGSIWPFFAGKFVELPYTLPQDHTLFYVLKVKDIAIWKNKIDWILNYNGVILALTHPDYLIPPDHLDSYSQLLEYLFSIKNSYRCLPKELTNWWIKKEKK